MSTASARQSEPGSSAVFKASWPPVLLMLMLAFGFLIGERVLDSQKYDQDLYHIQVIRQFETQLPTPDISNYGAATGPGYHLLYALIGQVTGSDLETLRWISPLIAVGLIVVVAGFCTTRCSPNAAALLTSPLAVSYYLLGSAVYLQTDNLAWLFVVLALGPLVFLRPSLPILFSSGCCLLLAVFVRQNFIWIAGPIVACGLLDSPLARSFGLLRRDGSDDSPSTWRTLVVAVLVVIPAFALLSVFRWLWGGLVPPNSQYFHSFVIPWIAGGFTLALLGFYGPFFLLVIPRATALIRRHAGGLLIAALLGAACGLVPPGNFDVDSGRSGGLMWKLVELGPAPGDRSLVLGFFAAIGAASLFLLWLAMREAREVRSGLILLCALAAATSTTFLNSLSYQRYFELPIFLFLVWSCALCLRGPSDYKERVAAGPALLAVVLAVLFAVASTS